MDKELLVVVAGGVAMVAVGVLRVLSTDDRVLLESHGRLVEEVVRDSSLRAYSRCIEGHPRGLPKEEEREAVPKIRRLGREMANGFSLDSLMVSCCADPGVAELREDLEIPVIGAGEASAHVALALNAPVGVLGIGKNLPGKMGRILGDLMVGYERPQQIRTTVDIYKGGYVDDIFKACQALITRGARSLLLACTGFSTIRLHRLIQQKFHMPVIDPVISAGFIAYQAASPKAPLPVTKREITLTLPSKLSTGQ